MLISNKHKFLTIDIPKTSTRSLRETLVPLGIIDIIGSPHGDHPYEKFFFQHANIKLCKTGFKKIGWNFDEYFKYSVVRNPWARFVSFFEWSRRHRPELNFDLKTIIKRELSQDYFLLDDFGELPFDIIGKLENINEDFRVFCQGIGLEIIPNLKHSNKTIYKKDYKEYYNQELIDMVAKKEKWVIDKFGYTY